MRKIIRVFVATAFTLCGTTTLRLAAQTQDPRLQAALDAVKANPNDATAHFNLGQTYFNTAAQNNDPKMFQMASAEFQRVVQINSNDKEARELLESSQGIAAYLTGDYSNAANHFQNTLKINPKNPNANLLLGKSYVNSKQPEKAELALKSYAAAFPEDSQVQTTANLGLGKIYLDENKFKEAIEAFRLAAANPPREKDLAFELYENLGVTYFKIKDFPNAAETWEKALTYQKDSQIYKFLGWSYYNNGKFSEAIKDYKKSLEMNPNDEETFYNLGVAYQDNSSYDEAADSFAQAFKLDPKDALAANGQAACIGKAIDAHMQNANNSLLQSKYSDAIGELNKVLKIEPNNKQAQDLIADTQLKLQQEVEKDYQDGLSFKQRGDSAKALDSWNKALEMDPANEKVLAAKKKLIVSKTQQIAALLYQGKSLEGDQDYEGAIQKYQKVLQLSSHNKEARSRIAKLNKQIHGDYAGYLNRAQKSYAKGQLKNAVDYLEQAKQIKSSPEVKDLLFKYKKDLRQRTTQLLSDGETQMSGGNKDQAKKKFTQVLAMDPSNQKAADDLKQLTGQQAVKVDPEKVKALFYEGVKLYVDGKIAEAIAKWKEVLALDKNNINAQNNLRKAELKLKSIQQLSGG